MLLAKKPVKNMGQEVERRRAVQPEPDKPTGKSHAENAGDSGSEANGMRILGIDPGLRTMGWGVIEADGPRMRHVANGLCQSEGTDLAPRLLSLYRQLEEVMAAYMPDTAAGEQTFVNKDAVGTLKLGQARAIALLVPAQAGLDVGEYAPNKVKKTVVGVGHADKRQIEHMVKLQLPGCAPAGPDAADALAVAICHAFHAGARQPLKVRA